MKPTDTSSGLAQNLLTELLSYDPATGGFTWKVARSGNVKVGDAAGSLNKKSGYREIWIGERLYGAHRLAWFYMTGEWPEFTVDHENLSRADNRWLNLRPATQAQQCANRGIKKGNTSGFKGVSLVKATGKWCASIKINGKSKNLGSTYSTPEEAAEVYAKALTAVHGEFARTI